MYTLTGRRFMACWYGSDTAYKTEIINYTSVKTSKIVYEGHILGGVRNRQSNLGLRNVAN